MKKAVLLLTMLLSINIVQAEEKKVEEVNISMEEEAILWEKQTEYLNNLKKLESELKNINDKLENCRESYYSITESDQLKNDYLKDTKDYSTNLIVTSTILNQAIGKLENKMQNERGMVLEGLYQYKDTLSDHINKEKERNIQIQLKMEDGFKLIKEKYCTF